MIPPPAELPPEMLAAPRWIIHRAKVPLDHRTGRPGAVTDPAIRLPFGEANRVAAEMRADGLGYVLGDGWCGVDLDDVRDVATGAVAEWAGAIVHRLDAYTEVSVSGTGLHVICRGSLPPGRRRHGRGVELYDRARHFVMTARPYVDAPLAVPDRTDELARLHGELFPAVAAPAITRAPVAGLDDAAVLDRCRAAANGAKFSRLWAGDLADYPSPSEAELALANLLAWYSQDAGQVERLMSASALGARDKWQRRADYRARTIAAALDHVGATRTGGSYARRA